MQQDAATIQSVEDEVQEAMTRAEEHRSKKEGCCFSCDASDSALTETPPRVSIPGSFLTDFIQLNSMKPWCNAVDFIHALCMFGVIFYSLIKLFATDEGQLFLTMKGMPDWQISSFQIDALEVLTLSPRFLSIWTMCYFSRSKFIGKKNSASAV